MSRKSPASVVFLYTAVHYSFLTSGSVLGLEVNMWGWAFAAWRQELPPLKSGILLSNYILFLVWWRNGSLLKFKIIYQGNGIMIFNCSFPSFSAFPLWFFSPSILPIELRFKTLIILLRYVENIAVLAAGCVIPESLSCIYRWHLSPTYVGVNIR